MLQTRKGKDLLQLAIAVVVLILLNFLANRQFKRFDLTSEHRYSLSDSTKSILRNLNDVALVTVYLEGKDLNADFKRLRNATKEMLDEFHYYAGGNLEYRFVDPFAEPDPETREGMYKELIEKGLMPTNLTDETENGRKVIDIFPGAIVSYGGNSVAVQLLESQFNQDPLEVLNQSVERLEYNLSKGLYRAIHFQDKKKIAFSRGHGEMDEMNLAFIVDELRDYYEVVGVEINNNLDALNSSISCLVIAKPDSAFDDAAKFSIDQYIMNGGRVLWLMDNVFANMDSMGTRSYTVAVPNDLNLYDQLFKYGVRINPTLIQDAECAPIRINIGNFGTQSNNGIYPWYYYPVITPGGKHPIVKNLNAVRLEFASSIDTVKAPGVKKTILLETSDMTKVLFAPVRIALNIIEQKPTPDLFNKQHVPTAVLLEGEFHSVFENRIVQLGNRPMLSKSEPTKMIVVSDGDIAKNLYGKRTGQVVPLGLDPLTGTYYPGNKTFMLNAINYLADDTWFIPLRSKDFRIRKLDRTRLSKKSVLPGLTVKDYVKVVNFFVPLVIIIAFGLVYTYFRRRRYAR